MNPLTLEQKAELYHHLISIQQNPIQLPEDAPAAIVAAYAQAPRNAEILRNAWREEIRQETAQNPVFSMAGVSTAHNFNAISVEFWPGTDAWEKYGWYVVGSLIMDAQQLEAYARTPDAYIVGRMQMEGLQGIALDDTKKEALRAEGFMSHEIRRIHR